MERNSTRTAVRFYSHNFIYDGQAPTTDKQATRDWKAKYTKNVDESKVKFYYDSKNSIHCCNATMDWICYYNYMTLLNQLYEQWNCYGLFDQQYKPYVYMPSFWNDPTVAEALLEMATRAGANIISTAGTSFMYYGKALGPAEYWIHKNDLAKVVEYASQSFRDTFGLPDIGKYSFGTSNPDEVKTSQIVRVFANLEQELGEMPHELK